MGVAVEVTDGLPRVLSTDLSVLLGVILGNKGLQVRPLSQSEECDTTGFLREKLQYRNRLQYMVTGPSSPTT